MKAIKFLSVCKTHKECPKCGTSWKSPDLSIELKDNYLKIICVCGFEKRVADNSEDVE